MVQDFDRYFRIIVCKNIDADLRFCYEAKGGFEICFPSYQFAGNTPEDYFDTSVVKRSTSLSFSIGMDVKLQNLESIRRFLLALQKTFDTAFEKNFGKQGKNGIKMYGKKRDARMEISTQDAVHWDHRSEDWWSVFTKALRAARPDLSSNIIANEVDKFIHSSYREDTDELLEKFRNAWSGSKCWTDHLVYASEKIDVSDDGVLQFHIKKPLSLNSLNVEIYKDVNEKVPFRILGCEKMTYDLGSSMYDHMSDFKGEIDWLLDNLMDSVGEITLKTDGSGASDFADKVVDLTAMFPGQKILFRLTSKEAIHSDRTGYNGNECVVPEESFRFTVKTSAG